MKTFNLVILVIWFSSQILVCQDNAQNCCYKYPICSKNKHNLTSEITRYNANNKWLVSSIGFQEVEGHYKLKDDSVKLATVISTGYYPMVIDIDPINKYPGDTVFLNRISKDSIYIINGFTYDTTKHIDLNSSKIVIDIYCTFLKRHTTFSFKLLCFKDDKTSVENITIFYNEIKKRFPQFARQVTLEYSENRKYSNGIFITGRKIKK